MAVQTLQELQDLMHLATKQITNLDGKKIRFAWQTQGQPSQTIDEDVIYLALSQIDNLYDKQQDITFDGDYEQENWFYTRVMECTWFCYGPNSFEYADDIRNGILYESIRNLLRVENVFPVLGIMAPTRVPYHFDDQWWERSDLKVLFNVGTLREIPTAPLEAADIEVYTEDGLQRTAHISE